MSENESKRASAVMTWYSVYQNQVVGQPSTLWSASEEDVTAKNMSNGFDIDDDDALVKTNCEESTLDWNHSKDSDNWNHPKDSNDGKYSKDANDIKDEHQQTHNNKNFTVENGNSMNSSSSSQSLLRPLSMDVVGWMEQKKVKVEGEPGLQRSRSTIANWDDYEEFKLPKQYQKPTNTQINTRLSRTYITGAGNDKCKNCGQRLYEMEKINANHSSYHRTCFQCSRCQRLLSLSNFISMDGQLYCSSHFLDVVCNKTNIAEATQMSNGSDEKHDQPHLPDTQKISKDVTLTSINDIKSRFESPSNNNNNNNNEIESEIKSKDEHPKKIRPLTEDVQQVQHHPTSTFKHSASSSASHDNKKPFELNADTTRSRRLKENEEKEAFVVVAHQSSIASPTSTFTSNDDNYTLPVADAFAIFKTMENMSIERIPSSEIKPAKKMPLTLQLKTSAKDGLQENKEMGNHLSYSSTTQNAKKRDEKLHVAVGIHDAVSINDAVSIHNAVSIHDAAMKENIVAALEDDVPPVGITKQLVEQWKRMDATDGSSLLPLHRSHAQVMSSTPSSISRRSTTDEMTHDVSGSSSKIINNNMTNDSLQLTSGFHVTGPATYGYENTLVRKHDEIVAQDTSRLLRKKGGQEMAATEPIDFTRNQLAKFKVLEAMAQKSTNHYPLSKKDFRWGVKEVSPLHRPISQANQTPPAAAAMQIGLKRDDSMLPPAVVIHNPFFADQTDAWDGWKKTDYDHRANLSANHNQTNAWNGLKTDYDHPHANLSANHNQTNAWNGLKTDYDHRHQNQNVTHIVAFADQRNDAIEEEPILACMKEALAQFKSMEDLTRPPPNPVIALSKQRQAIATHTKQYHDVIHVSYATQTARD